MKSPILLTGASRGVGRATAQLLATRGQNLILLGRPSAALEETLADVKQRGVQAELLSCDLSQSTQVQEASRVLLDRYGPPATIIHNAGIVERVSLLELTEESWRQQMEVNLTAPFLLTQALLPALLAQKSGRILFVASISAQVGTARQCAYNASKAGLVSFMRCLAEEISDTGLMTAAVLPGGIDTEMLQGSGFPARMHPEEVARTLSFLSLDASLAHNGAVLEMFGV